MSSNYYPKGNVIRCSGTFLFGTTPVDPATINFSLKNPLGSYTNYSFPYDIALVRDSVGAYHVDVDGNMVGNWYYRFWSIGFESANETRFIISSSQF